MKKIGIYLNGQQIGTLTPCDLATAALCINHIPTLEAYLEDAINSEDFEYAARIRDRIREAQQTDKIPPNNILFND